MYGAIGIGLERMAQKVADAINAAEAGAIVDQSEEPARYALAELISLMSVCHSTADFQTSSLIILLDKYREYPYLPVICIIVKSIKVNL